MQWEGREESRTLSGSHGGCTDQRGCLRREAGLGALRAGHTLLEAGNSARVLPMS